MLLKSTRVLLAFFVLAVITERATAEWQLQNCLGAARFRQTPIPGSVYSVEISLKNQTFWVDNFLYHEFVQTPTDIVIVGRLDKRETWIIIEPDGKLKKLYSKRVQCIP